MRELLARRKWDFVGIGMALLVGAVLIYGNLTVFRPKKHQVMCQSNLKQIGLGMHQYVRDYDEQYPLAANWHDSLLLYMRKDPAIFQCPARSDLTTGYAYHKRISDVRFITVTSAPANSIFAFDSDANQSNASDYGTSLPRTPRHRDGHNILFADGHVKAMVKPNFILGFNAVLDFTLRDQMEKEKVIFWRESQQREARRRKVAAWQQKQKVRTKQQSR